MKPLIILMLTTFLYLTNIVYSQIPGDSPVCDADELDALNIVYSTPDNGRYFKVLIIYVNFPDDNLTGGNPPFNIWPRPNNGITTVAKKPLNYYHLDGRMIDPSEVSNTNPFMDRYSEYTYSDYFCEMSMGTFDFVGDEIAVLLSQNSTYYDDNNIGYGAINLEALQLADNLGVDYSDYDNWDNISHTWGSDGVVDFVLIQYRRVPNNNSSWFYGNPAVGGSTYISVNTTIDGKAIDRGVWGIGGLYNTTRTQLIMEHEFSHYIFGAYFNHPDINPWHVSIGMMNPGNGNSTYTMTAMERSMPGLNYTTPTLVTSSGGGEQNFTLGDFISEGDVLKIQIPNTSNPTEYFWVSNHQKVSVYDGISRGSNTCWETNKYQQDPYCGEGKGIYIFHESGHECSNNENDSKNYPFDLENADGKNDWAYDRTVSDPNLGSFDIQKVSNGDRSDGVSEFNKYKLRSTTWSAQLITDDPCSDGSNDYFITGDFHGDGLDAFNMDYDEIFSPYSNPSTNPCANPSTNSGVTIVLKQFDHGSIDVTVYFDDQKALDELPPSKPKNLIGSKHYININTGLFNPKITWDSNIEPDFNDEGDPGYYKILRGFTTNCESEPSSYTQIATATYDDTYFIDEAVDLYDEIGGSGICEYDLQNYHYKIIAVDNTDLQSLRSEKTIISGWADPCAPDDSPSLNNNSVPTEFALHQNYPNPFNPVTNIQYQLPTDEFVTIKVYDINGREISVLINETKKAGHHLVSFNAAELSSGIYYYKITAGSFNAVKRMVLIK